MRLEMRYTGAKGGDGFSHSDKTQTARHSMYRRQLMLLKDALEDESKAEPWFTTCVNYPSTKWRFTTDAWDIDSGKGVLPYYWFQSFDPMQIVDENLMQDIYDAAGIFHGPIEFNGNFEGWRLIWYIDAHGRKQFKALRFPSNEWMEEAGDRHLKVRDEFYPHSDELAGRSRYGRRGLLTAWRCNNGHFVRGSQYGCPAYGCGERRPLPDVHSSKELYSVEYNERMKREMAAVHADQKERRLHMRSSFGYH